MVSELILRLYQPHELAIDFGRPNPFVVEDDDVDSHPVDITATTPLMGDDGSLIGARQESASSRNVDSAARKRAGLDISSTVLDGSLSAKRIRIEARPESSDDVPSAPAVKYSFCGRVNLRSTDFSAKLCLKHGFSDIGRGIILAPADPGERSDPDFDGSSTSLWDLHLDALTVVEQAAARADFEQASHRTGSVAIRVSRLRSHFRSSSPSDAGLPAWEDLARRTAEQVKLQSSQRPDTARPLRPILGLSEAVLDVRSWQQEPLLSEAISATLLALNIRSILGTGADPLDPHPSVRSGDARSGAGSRSGRQPSPIGGPAISLEESASSTGRLKQAAKQSCLPNVIHIRQSAGASSTPVVTNPASPGEGGVPDPFDAERVFGLGCIDIPVAATACDGLGPATRQPVSDDEDSPSGGRHHLFFAFQVSDSFLGIYDGTEEGAKVWNDDSPGSVSGCDSIPSANHDEERVPH